MTSKPSSRQQAQLAFLQTLPAKFQRIHNIVEQMSSQRADEAMVGRLARLLDEIKGNSSALSLSGITETAGIMGTMVRRGGGVQFKVRGLRELLVSLKTNYEGALRSASTVEPAPEGGS
jgi:chemotaxis protein histidine kinase CheA